ncbi:hypothetical protein V3C99_004950 [Haemonchus contortus]
MSASGTFLSYIGDQTVDEGKPADRPGISSSDVDGSLLKGEIECAFCEQCSFGFPFLENTFGRVVCTNFRLRFEPVAKPENDLSPRFKIFHERWDIPLCSIHSIFFAPVRQNQSLTKKKFLPSTSSLSSLEVVSCIKLHLKDFRVMTIDLRGSQNGVSLLNQILFFARPMKTDNIIQSGAEPDWRGRVPFNDAASWDGELKRCGHRTQEDWRICSQFPHGARHFVHSFPMYFVIPAEIVQHDLDRMAQHWQLSRFPIWVWSRSGVSLLRSSNFDVNWESPHLNDKVIKSVARATRSENPPQLISLNPEITPQKIASSFDRLRRYCSAESYEQFASRDKDWLARISQTGWLQIVSYCLSAAAEAIDSLVDHECSVIIYENNGLDISAVVSSLVQICCDRYYRTLEGLDSLIAKDWIALGHPFAHRLFGISGGTNEGVTAPTFLVFLDCIAQLIRLYPMQFTYTQHALIALWDLSLTGMVPAFSASSITDQIASNKTGSPFPLERFFNESYSRLFSNITNIGAAIVEKASGHPLIYEILRPPTSIADLQLWNECYLRWIPAANVTHGGAVMDDLALKEAILEEFPSAGIVMSRFGLADIDLETVSSAYPYSMADVNQRGYFANRESDSLSISSMSLSVHEDRWKHRASVPVLGGIPETNSSLSYADSYVSTSSDYAPRRRNTDFSPKETRID